MINADQRKARPRSFALSKIDYIKILTKVSAVFLSVGSYLTSLLGACLYVSNNIPVAFMLSTGFQIGVFVFSHGAAKVKDAQREKISKILRLCAFLPCLAFSAYMSTLGTYSVLRPSLEAGNERAALQAKLRAASYEQRRLSTSALAYLNDQIVETGRLLEVQKRRLQVARRLYTRLLAQRELDRLSSKLSELNRAKEKVDGVGQASDAMPDSPEVGRGRIDAAAAKASSILSAMPAEFRDANQLPQPEPEPAPPADIQGSFVQELRRSAPSAYYCLAIALLLDLTSILIIRSVTPTPTLPERIRRARRYMRDLRAARSEPLDLFTQQIRLLVAGLPDLSINLDLGAEDRDLYLDDLKPHLGHVEERVGAELGRLVKISSLSSSTGMELLPDLPLKSQLDADNTIHLQIEAANERAIT
jgi:hypothetical protein